MFDLCILLCIFGCKLISTMLGPLLRGLLSEDHLVFLGKRLICLSKLQFLNALVQRNNRGFGRSRTLLFQFLRYQLSPLLFALSVDHSLGSVFLLVFLFLGMPLSELIGPFFQDCIGFVLLLLLDHLELCILLVLDQNRLLNLFLCSLFCETFLILLIDDLHLLFPLLVPRFLLLLFSSDLVRSFVVHLFSLLPLQFRFLYDTDFLAGLFLDELTLRVVLLQLIFC